MTAARVETEDVPLYPLGPILCWTPFSLLEVPEAYELSGDAEPRVRQEALTWKPESVLRKSGQI